MLTIYDRPARPTRDRHGMTRRNFVRVGGLGLAGLSLPQLLAQEASQKAVRHKSLILIYLVGGPPHLDMWDLKPHAPSEVRGEFQPIQTNVPGIELCEHLPQMAQRMDRFAIIRSIVDAQDDHHAFQCYTGRDQRKPMPVGGWPQLGSAVSHLQGPVNVAVPPMVSLCYRCSHGPYNEPGPGFLGVGQAGFQPLTSSRETMTLQGITTERLADRRRLLAAVDRLRREMDQRRLHGVDQFTEQAMGILTSSKLADALDLSNEDPRSRSEVRDGRSDDFYG